MSILTAKLEVLNIGLGLFAEALMDQGVAVVQVDWHPYDDVGENVEDMLSDLM